MASQQMVESELHAGESSSVTTPRRQSETGRGIAEKLADALGWFSIALGITKLVAPRAMSRWLGVRHRPTVMRVTGLREITAGVGILTTPKRDAWLWARVGGDLIDIAALERGSKGKGASAGRANVAMSAVLGVTVLDAVCATQLSDRGEKRTVREPVHFTTSASINKSPEECYRFWHDIENLPRFMEHVKSVRVTGEGRSHWIVEAPGGKEISWDAEITEDIPNERIAWKSLEGADVVNWGSVRFERAPAGRGTIVRVRMQYGAPGGTVGATLLKALGPDPGLQVHKNLRRFKQLLETGEIATTEGQSAGRASGATWLDRLARI